MDKELYGLQNRINYINRSKELEEINILRTLAANGDKEVLEVLIKERFLVENKSQILGARYENKDEKIRKNKTEKLEHEMKKARLIETYIANYKEPEPLTISKIIKSIFNYIAGR